MNKWSIWANGPKGYSKSSFSKYLNYLLLTASAVTKKPLFKYFEIDFFCSFCKPKSSVKTEVASYWEFKDLIPTLWRCLSRVFNKKWFFIIDINSIIYEWKFMRNECLFLIHCWYLQQRLDLFKDYMNDSLIS